MAQIAREKTRQPDKENIHLMLRFQQAKKCRLWHSALMDYFFSRRMTCFVSCKSATPVNHSASVGRAGSPKLLFHISFYAFVDEITSDVVLDLNRIATEVNCFM